ncbi:cysteine desulfurase-like protein [Virgisporangium ochraceum]|uniref:Cysteine desulfurase-like protein n=1 Tax=Virgisporangium ochraceum TaxID=65505 RepID=A0A8J3ZS59_9ACTN|nr:cysteine desulfurase-like protein [Virgisporangium ochraceum]GIJ67365.1 cysteine desulfurase-like protein [Virgisporangium ochraceum]
MGFDVERVRAAYPALAEGFVHFDGAAGTLVARGVADAIATTLTTAVGNRTTVFEAGRRSNVIVAAARDAVADLVNGDPAGVVFGPSATALTYLVARTLSTQWERGDEVVVSRLDHDANVRPWVQAAERRGATVRWAEFDPATGELPVEQYRSLVTDRTKIVAVTAASNAIGTRPDVAAIADVAHAVEALVYVDGVHSTAHVPTDIEELRADFYVTSAYKWSGPHLAACVAKPQVWERMRPDKLMPSPDTVPDRFEFGTLSFELLAGVTAAVDHLAGLAPGIAQTRRDKVVASLTEAHAYASQIFEKLVSGLERIEGVTVLPAPPGRCPTVSFRVDREAPATTATALGDQGICVYSGDYYAYEYFQSTGLRDSGGGVRASVYHYNTAAEVDRLLQAVAERAHS